MANPVKFCSFLEGRGGGGGRGLAQSNLNYAKHSMVRLLYRFHVYYNMKRIFKKNNKFHCHMKLILKLLKIPIPMKNFKKFARIINFLTIS